jgi:hypothetical protein
MRLHELLCVLNTCDWYPACLCYVPDGVRCVLRTTVYTLLE